MRINHRENQEEIIELYNNFFLKNKEVFILAGELNPDFYERIISKCYPQAKDTVFNFICGPFISVKDDLFRKYHDIHKNHLGNWWYAEKKGEWWKIHPVFEKAYKNDKLNIYIIKQRYQPHFCLGSDTKDIIIEEPHDELNESQASVYYGDNERASEHLNIWHKIKDNNCYKWDENSHDSLFKPIYKFKRESELEERIKIELSSPTVLST